MTDELPKCRLCGQEPTHLSGGRVSHICVTPEAEWRRLHGPQPELTGVRLGDVLVRAGVIDAAAVEDPDGYDGGQTVDALAMAARELAMPLHSATNTAELATAMQSAPPSRRRGMRGCKRRTVPERGSGVCERRQSATRPERG